MRGLQPKPPGSWFCSPYKLQDQIYCGWWARNVVYAGQRLGSDLIRCTCNMSTKHRIDDITCPSVQAYDKWAAQQAVPAVDIEADNSWMGPESISFTPTTSVWTNQYEPPSPQTTSTVCIAIAGKSRFCGCRRCEA